MGIFLLILAGVLLLSLVSGAYVFTTACVRRKELPWFDEVKLKKTSYGKYHKAILASDAWLKEHSAQDIYVTSHDGLRLHGLWVPAENAKGTVLLAHGYRSTMLVDFGLAFAYYHSLNMNILVPQQRSHGESQGRYITFGVKESRDMCAWIDFHNEHFGTFQMILSGLSMGASTVLYMADMKLPENVKGIIADCGFTSPYQILRKVFHSVTHMRGDWILHVTDVFARLFAGFSLKEKDTRTVLKNAKLPVLMIHGTQDNFVPVYMTQQGFDACTSEKSLLLVEGAGHGTSFLFDKEGYMKKVFAFLETYLADFSRN